MQHSPTNRSGPLPGDRDFLAFVVAIVAPAPVWVTLTWGWRAWTDGVSAATAEIPRLLLVGMTFGIAVTLFLVVLVVTPLYLWLGRTGWIRWWTAIATGAAVGALAGLPAPIMPPPIGAMVGATTAMLWWRVSRRSNQTPFV